MWVKDFYVNMKIFPKCFSNAPPCLKYRYRLSWCMCVCVRAAHLLQGLQLKSWGEVTVLLVVLVGLLILLPGFVLSEPASLRFLPSPFSMFTYHLFSVSSREWFSLAVWERTSRFKGVSQQWKEEPEEYLKQLWLRMLQSHFKGSILALNRHQVYL